MRRIGSALISAVVAGALFAAPQTQATASAPSTSAPATSAPSTSGLLTMPAKKIAAPSKACRKRVANPSTVVPSKRFARCVAKGMLKGKTAHLKSDFGDGMWNKGDARFTKKYTETSARYHDGSRLVFLGGSAWYKPSGEGWAKAKKSGSPNEQLAWTIQQLWLGLTSTKAYTRALKASSTGWTPTKRHKVVNGVKAREYVGTVTLGGQAYDDYRVWVDKWDRPIRINSTLTMYGMTSVGQQDFTRWGGKVSIVAPKVR